MRGGVEKLNTARGVAECCIEPSAVLSPTRALRAVRKLIYCTLGGSSPRVPGFVSTRGGFLTDFKWILLAERRFHGPNAQWGRQREPGRPYNSGISLLHNN